MSQPDPHPRPNRTRARHALLFELIRQRSMAQSVTRRQSESPEPDAIDLHHIARTASRSIAPSDSPHPRP